jgi:organic hydroperoxide reductase OsmC/OhrA
VATRAKTFSYAVSVDRDGTAHSEQGGPPLAEEEAWSPEHLVLAGLARCILTSLDYHARRSRLAVSGTTDARAEVTKRDTDGRYAFVQIKVDVDVKVDPQPQAARELVAKAERDCFVGASLTASPRYHWTVNGEELL